LFWNKICGFIAIFFICPQFLIAQPDASIKVSSLKFIPKLSTTPAYKTQNGSVKLSRPFTVIAPNYYTQHFGIMCKKELALEKATKIPFRFRLGTLQHCNYLEGKK